MSHRCVQSQISRTRARPGLPLSDPGRPGDGEVRHVAEGRAPGRHYVAPLRSASLGCGAGARRGDPPRAAARRGHPVHRHPAAQEVFRTQAPARRGFQWTGGRGPPGPTQRQQCTVVFRRGPPTGSSTSSTPGGHLTSAAAAPGGGHATPLMGSWFLHLVLLDSSTPLPCVSYHLDSSILLSFLCYRFTTGGTEHGAHRVSHFNFFGLISLLYLRLVLFLA
jgi:hypothetical protein